MIMMMAKQAKQDDLLKQLRKSYKNVGNINDEWERSIDSATSLVKLLANVAEQYHCILRVSRSELKSPLVKTFPDIPGCILHKLTKEMELILDKLSVEIAEMGRRHSKIHQQYLNAMAAYKRCSHHMSVEEVAMGTATWPSIASMLEWLLDLDCIFQCLYENQVQALDSVDYSNEQLMQSLPKKWTRGNKEAKESIENVLAHVSFFMADG